MYRTTCLLAALAVWTANAAGELRTWKSKTGERTIEASFVKEEKGFVTLRLKDGTPVTTRLDALCDEDRDYVLEATYVPQEVKAVFKRDPLTGGFTESGDSADATARDTAVLLVDGATRSAASNVKGDTSWKIESVDALGKTIRPRGSEVTEELRTDGKFVFVTYRVKNDALAPVDIPSPLLYDSKGRMFTQTARNGAQAYIPEGTRFAGAEPLQPGFTKLYCAFYEVPEDAVPAAVEVFPSAMKPHLPRVSRPGAGSLRGKRILLGVKMDGPEPAPRQGVADDAPGTAVPDAGAAGGTAGKVSLFMNCVRLGSSGSSSGSYYRSKTRALTYAADLRLLGEQTQNVKVRGYFIGEATGGREVILDVQESDVVLEPGRAARVTLTSDEISETKYRSYYYGDTTRLSGAKLKGVVIQAWKGNALVSGWASMPQWRKYAENRDLLKELGEMKKSEEGF
jgi:hypothetical protein